MKELGTGSVFRRLFLMFMVMVIAVYGVLMVVFVNYTVQQRKVETSGHINSVVSSTSVLTQQLNAVYNVEAQFFNDVRVARLAHRLYADNYEKSKLILDLLSSLQNTQSTNSIIEDIVILFPLEGIELSAYNGYHKRSFDPEMFHSARSTADEPLVIHDGHVEMNIAYPIWTVQEELPDYQVRIILSLEYLDSFLESFRTSGLEGAFWVLRSGSGELTRLSPREGETGLMEQWARMWVKAGSPKHLEEVAFQEGSRFRLVSQGLEDYNLLLATYKDSRVVAWELGGEVIYIVLTVLLMGAFFGFFILRANQTVNKPIRRIMEAFQKVSAGDLQVRLTHRSNDEFGYIYDSFNETVGRIESLIDNVAEQRNLLQKAELMQLQSQINPHFLYNSFYNLKFMAQNEDYGQIETFVTALAKYYRFINKEAKLDVALSGEVAHMENYIEIQQMRFGDKITVRKEALPEELDSFRVPKLILQPVIENAYNYGFRDTLSDGLLTIRYRREGKLLCILIEDNGGKMTRQRLEEMERQIHTREGDALNHALTNIHRRLELAYGAGCGVYLSIGEAGGLQVTLKLDTSVHIQ